MNTASCLTGYDCPQHHAGAFSVISTGLLKTVQHQSDKMKHINNFQEGDSIQISQVQIRIISYHMIFKPIYCFKRMKSLELLFLIITTAYILGVHRGGNTNNKWENMLFCISYTMNTDDTVLIKATRKTPLTNPAHTINYGTQVHFWSVRQAQKCLQWR